MLTAWEKFYALGAHPFSLTPDLRFAYHSRSHSRALSEVTEALARREGIIVITGEIGTGKTMLCRTLLATFEPRTFLSVISDPRVTADELLQQLLEDFGLSSKVPAQDLSRPGMPAAPAPTRHQRVTTLQHFLASLIPLKAHAVVMLDEAQQLEPTVLEEIRLLSNFETDEAKLLQIVLVGQPNLEEVLQRPDMRQLNQRVARRCELHPLSPVEVQDYIQHRLAVASEPDRPHLVQFTPAAVRLIAEVSQGIPRVINTLCDRALEVGYERQTRVIDDKIVRAAADGLKLDMPALTGFAGRRWLGPAAAAILIVAALGAWRFLPQRSDRDGSVQPASRPAAAPVQPAPAAVAAPPPRPPAAAVDPPPNPAQAGSVQPSSAPAAPVRATDAPRTGAGASYNVQVAAFRTAQRAAQVAQALEAAGLPVTTRSDAGTGWHQILVGPFPSPEAAEAAQRTLAREGFSDTHVAPVVR